MKKISISIFCLLAVSALIVGFIVTKNLASVSAFSHTLASLLSKNDASQNVLFDFNTFANVLDSAEKVAETKLVSYFIPDGQKEMIATISTILPDLKTVVAQLRKDEQRWIFLFQNSNELRATGGFMGSYAIVEINNGKVLSITVEDIYDADGQFTGYVEAPSGVKEYLSSGKGLRLPDANWHADTQASATQILPFFGLGNKQNISGIVFVNLDFAKNLLDFLGPIEVADYNTIVTSENIDEVLRSRRDDFFPGSKQKKHLLSQLLNQVRFKLSSLSLEQMHQLLAMLAVEIQINNLQFYSNNNHIDEIFSKHTMRQVVSIPENTEYIYLVESNVGINKANKKISRNVLIQKKSNTRTIQVNFENDNAKPTVSKLSTELDLDLNPIESTTEARVNTHLTYVNYQRILVPETWNLNTITFNDLPVTQVQEETLYFDDSAMKQIGFLITVPEEEKGELLLSFNTPNDFETIYVQKQPGIPETNYILEYNGHTDIHTLTKNTVLNYPK